jgi:hypothetical protein
VLTDIGHTFVEVREGLHPEAFEDGVLKTALTDTVMKICSLKRDADWMILLPASTLFSSMKNSFRISWTSTTALLDLP